MVNQYTSKHMPAVLTSVSAVVMECERDVGVMA